MFLESPASFACGIEVTNTYAQTVGALQTKEIRVASFAAQLGGPSNDQDVEHGFHSPYNGAPSIPEATSAQVFDIFDVGETLSLADAINTFVEEEFCTPYVIVE